jgi:regulator of RNase E activity RraA
MDEIQPAIASIEQFRRLSTCLVSSAIETFQVRLPNTGFADSRVRSMFSDLGPVAGYAATARIRTSAPPMEGGGYHYARTDWWDHILAIPAPRIVVIEDTDDPPGLGAFVGEVNANILNSLGCVAVVTNGAVRDLPGIRALDFSLFAGNVSVTHAYAHIYDFGGPVRVGGMEVRPGDLLHADIHGIQTVPRAIAEKVPAAAQDILRKRESIISVCHSARSSIDQLRTVVQSLDKKSA